MIIFLVQICITTPTFLFVASSYFSFSLSLLLYIYISFLLCLRFSFMYSELDIFSFLGMSNSEIFLSKEDGKEIKIQVSSRPILEFPDGCQVSASSSDPELQENDDKCEVTESCKELKTPLLGEFEVADDDDGFRTPTSLDHKIPPITQCPKAPRKLKPQQSRKRKLSSKLRRNLPLDLSEEVESLFPPTLQDNMGRKMKKARRDVEE